MQSLGFSLRRFPRNDSQWAAAVLVPGAAAAAAVIAAGVALMATGVGTTGKKV